jgi:acetyl esterase/lipase
MKAYLFILLNFFTLALMSQEIKIWPRKIPGSISFSKYTEQVKFNNGKPANISRVIDPTLTAYIVPKNKTTGVAVVICPGGGYSGLAISYEGHEIAEWFNQFGVSAFVLKYRLPFDSIMEDKSIGPLQDAQEAIRIVRRNALKWGINPSKIGVIGFSAGGHLAATLSTHYHEKVYPLTDSTSARPDFSILIYPVITLDSSYTDKGTRQRLIGKSPTAQQVRRFSNELQVNSATPPAFLVHSFDDRIVPVQNSVNYFLALKAANVPAEMHIFPKGGHGYGLAQKRGNESAWPVLLQTWLKPLL